MWCHPSSLTVGGGDGIPKTSRSAPRNPNQVSKGHSLQQVDQGEIWSGGSDDILGGGDQAVKVVPEDDYHEILYEEEGGEENQARGEGRVQPSPTLIVQCHENQDECNVGDSEYCCDVHPEYVECHLRGKPSSTYF